MGMSDHAPIVPRDLRVFPPPSSPPPERETQPPRPRPTITLALIGFLVLAYGAEVLVSWALFPQATPPTLGALVASGGLLPNLVTGEGDWFRLLTMAFVHGSLTHLVMNAICLGYLGLALESRIGGEWIIALFLLCAPSASLASMFWNPPGLVAVGASGAIMGLTGFLLVLSLRSPEGQEKKYLFSLAIGIGVGTLLPSFLQLTGGPIVDHAAHAGGFLSGVALGLLAIPLWRNLDEKPRGTRVAQMVSVAGVAVTAIAAVILIQDYPTHLLTQKLAPQDVISTVMSKPLVERQRLFARYPDDPRMRYVVALGMAQQGQVREALPDFRVALDQVETHQRLFPEPVRREIRLLLAIALSDTGDSAEARKTAALICGAALTPEQRQAIGQFRLCP